LEPTRKYYSAVLFVKFWVHWPVGRVLGDILHIEEISHPMPIRHAMISSNLSILGFQKIVPLWKTSGCFEKRLQQSEQASTVTYILARHHDVGLTYPGMFLLVPKSDTDIFDGLTFTV
jgi:hypothetical protein